MTNSRESLPQAIIEKKRFAWLFWLAPAGALLLCGWFVYRDFIMAGPRITLYFQQAEGVEPKNTELKYRGVNVGEVESVDLAKGGDKVKITARLTRSVADLANAGSIFWIVRPELKLGSISGLRTIVSGEYITIQPGRGGRTNVFQGVETEPLSEEPEALLIVLKAPDLGSLQKSSAIFYRGIKVGEVLFFQLAEDSREVVIHARIHQEYKPLVRSNSRFWNAGGIDVHFGLFKGIQVSAESAATLVSGGIEFATPPELADLATNGAAFTLYEKPEDKWKTWMPVIPLKLPRQVSQTNELSNFNLK